MRPVYFSFWDAWYCDWIGKVALWAGDSETGKGVVISNLCWQCEKYKSNDDEDDDSAEVF
jgi:hypothetical protein